LTNKTCIARSPDGNKWTITEIPYIFKSLAVNDYVFAGVDDKSKILYSNDALSWKSWNMTSTKINGDLNKIIAFDDPNGNPYFSVIGQDCILLLSMSGGPLKKNSGPFTTASINEIGIPQGMNVIDITFAGNLTLYAVGTGDIILKRDSGSWNLATSGYVSESSSPNLFLWILIALAIFYLIKRKKRGRR
jgi:hypothetical protein